MNQNSSETIATIHLKFTITVGSIAFFLWLITTVLYIFIPNDFSNKNKQQNIREIMKFSINTLGVCAAVTSAIYVGENIKRNILSQKIYKALDYISAWNNPEFRDIKVNSLRILNKKKNDSGLTYLTIIKSFYSDKDGKVDENKYSEMERKIFDVLNFFEELSLAIRNNLIDEMTAREFFDFILRKYWEIFEEWVEEMRNNRGYPDLYIYTEKLARNWKDNPITVEILK